MEAMILGLLAKLGISKEDFVSLMQIVHNAGTDLQIIKSQNEEILRQLTKGEHYGLPRQLKNGSDASKANPG